MTSYANASSETSQNNNDDDNNTKRDRKTQALSALLSATALGVFLEGCGGGDIPPPAAPPTPVVFGSKTNPYLATAGNNVFTGKEGLDSVSYAESKLEVGVEITLSEDATTLAIVAEGALGDKLTNIQNIIGSREDDTLTGNDQANSLQGSDGDDIISGGGGGDTLSGGKGSDTLHGGLGDDILHGGTGGDTLNGGDGADDYIFLSGHEADTISIDTDGGNLFFRAAKSFGDFTFERTSSNNYVKITIGEDSVEFRPDAYTHGDYTLYYGEDKILGTLIMGDASTGETLTGNDKRNVIIGGTGVDTIFGDAGDDILVGGAGGDEIRGGLGNDILFGDTGDDTLAGDAGTDTFIFRVGDGTDTITDVAGDTMTLRFIGDYVEGDFVAANIKRVDNKLEIILVKDGNTDKVTIDDAYDVDSSTGTGVAAFTIEVEYGIEGSDPTGVTLENSFWHALGTT